MPRSKRKRVIEPTQESDEEEYYEVEELVAHRKSKRNKSVTEYYVKWKGYDHSENTWEPEENIMSPGLIEEYWEKHNQRKKQEQKLQQLQQQEQKQQQLQLQHKPSPSTPKRKHASEEQENTTTESSSSSEEEAVIEQVSPIPNKKIHTTKKVPVSALPPRGMKWSDLIGVQHVFVDRSASSSPLLAQLKWPNDTTSFIMTKTLTQKAPEKLIDYYESHLVTSSTH